MTRIPFNRPFAVGDEIDYIRAAIATPKFSGDGKYTTDCQMVLEQSGYCCKSTRLLEILSSDQSRDSEAGDE